MQPYLKPIHKLISGFFILCTAICVFTPAIAQSENTAEKIPSTPTATAPNKQEVLTVGKIARLWRSVAAYPAASDKHV